MLYIQKLFHLLLLPQLKVFLGQQKKSRRESFPAAHNENVFLCMHIEMKEYEIDQHGMIKEVLRIILNILFG